MSTNQGFSDCSTGSASPALSHDLEVALGHAWSWFSLHSAQRMQMINYYILSVAFLTAGYATSAAADKYTVASIVALGGLAVSGIFNALDARTRELIRAAEPALKDLEATIVNASFCHLNLLVATGASARRTPSYRVTINVLTALAGVAFLGGFLHAIVSL